MSQEKSADDIFPAIGVGGCVQGQGETTFTPGTPIGRTLIDRGYQYGDYADMARMAQMLKGAMREGVAWQGMDSFHRESLEMIATKIARIVCGNPYHMDSWHDIAGYAKLAEVRCLPSP